MKIKLSDQATNRQLGPAQAVGAPWTLAEQDPDQPAMPEEVVIGEEGQVPADQRAEGPPTLPEAVPVLPIRQTVIFPGTIVPLGVGRPGSRQMLDESLPQSKLIGLFTQRNEADEEPTAEDLYRVGTVGRVLKLIRQPDDTVQIIVHGLGRVQMERALQHEPYIKAELTHPQEKPGKGKRFNAEVEQLRDQAYQLIELTPNAPEQATTVLMNIDDPSNLADFLAANLEVETDDKQGLLEELNVAKRIRRVHEHVSAQLENARLQQKIQDDVQSSISDTQRKMYLREQMKAIQRELGEDETGNAQMVRELQERLEQAAPPEKVMQEAQRELNRLQSIPPASPEYSMIVSYLELLADLPWSKSSEDNLDLDRARQILDRDHFDLEKVKRRLIEYLAVRKLNPNNRGPILCLMGPPGVGKTSLGQSVADALGREFARMSLGGIRDEAEIRGHRRTYIGAMPGRIIQEIRRCGTNNPVIMLDEVDKLGADFRGDPSSALLEVLDPRQNHQFSDRYLDVPFDLSQVIFIATGNYAGNIPPALKDRMETIDVPGYTEHDKVEIAKKYLVPRQFKENGLTSKHAKWRVAATRYIIEYYTREAGVRELERNIGAVCRAIAAQVAGAANGRKKQGPTTVEDTFVRQVLGPEQHLRELDTRTEVPGVAVGLAYTPVGGEVLFVEAAAYPGKGHVTLTGQIGEVMKESASAALSLFKSRAERFDFDIEKLAERDVHIHVPAGAVPKDGPSAGVAMYTAIASLLSGARVKNRLAMTGEITLRGKVLPVGGIKEKVLAASRAGVKTVVLPEKNRYDLEEVDEKVKKHLHFEYVDDVDQVLELALSGQVGKKAQRAARS
jgi:ATP-dependent Lon protease